MTGTLQRGVAVDFRMGRHRTDPHFLAIDCYAFQIADMRQIDERVRRGKTLFHGRQQCLTAGQIFALIANFRSGIRYAVGAVIGCLIHNPFS